MARSVLNSPDRSVQVAGPDRHESTADRQDAFDQSTGRGRHVGHELAHGDNGVAGGLEQLVLPIEAGGS